MRHELEISDKADAQSLFHPLPDRFAATKFENCFGFNVTFLQGAFDRHARGRAGLSTQDLLTGQLGDLNLRAGRKRMVSVDEYDNFMGAIGQCGDPLVRGDLGDDADIRLIG